MEKKELSTSELIDAARGCAGDLGCRQCPLCDDDCTKTLLSILADKLENATNMVATPHSSPNGDTFPSRGRLSENASEDDYRLTARDGTLGTAYFKKCFEEPCCGNGCKEDNCDFICEVCEKLCRYEEGTVSNGIEWIPCKAAKPAEEDEYLVMVAGAKKPTTLWYDPEEEMFYEEGTDLDPIYYPVTHWAELPAGPVGASSARPKENDAKSGRSMTAPTLEGGKEPVKRCATCRYEDRMAEEERCIECEKHSLWEERK